MACFWISEVAQKIIEPSCHVPEVEKELKSLELEDVKGVPDSWNTVNKRWENTKCWLELPGSKKEASWTSHKDWGMGNGVEKLKSSQLRWVQQSWGEFRRVEQRWEELGARGQSWELFRRVQKRWEEARWGAKRWKKRAIEKLWADLKRVEMPWEELRRAEKWWPQLKWSSARWGGFHRTEFRRFEASFTLTPIGKPCLSLAKCNIPCCWNLPPPALCGVYLRICTYMYIYIYIYM